MSREARKKYPGFQGNTSATTVLNVSIVKILDGPTPLFEDVASLQDSLVAFYLFNSYSDVCEVNYLLRVIPPAYTGSGPTRFDKIIEASLQMISGRTLDSKMLGNLQIPVNINAKTILLLGLRFTSTVTSSTAAFLSYAAFISTPLSDTIRDMASTSMLQSKSAEHVHELWVPMCSPGTIILMALWRQATAEKTYTIGTRSSQFTERVYGWNTSPETFPRFNVPAGVHRLDLLSTYNAFGTYISNREFRAWLQFYNRVPLYQLGTTRPRQNSGCVMGVLDDHLLHCT